MTDIATGDSMDELERIRKRKMEELMKISGNNRLEIEVNDNNFEKEVIEKSKEVPVVVDFWAAWCGPCLMLGPVLEKLAKEFNGKFILAKINVDENPVKSQEYGIMSIPSVKLFRNGKLADEFTGLLPETAVREWISSNIAQSE